MTLLGIIVCAAVPRRAGADDAYIRGYAVAVVQREFNVAPDAVAVNDAVVTVKADLTNTERDRLKKILRAIPGVRDVKLVEGAHSPERTWFPGRPLFRALMADPRWPNFSAAYHYYIDDRELKDVATVSFGESLPFVRYRLRDGSSVEVGLHAGVFAFFDLDASSFDLINADYFVGLPVTYAKGNFSVMGRVFHQSSHLGDEFLLRNRVNRINLSYEAIDLLLSYDFPFGFRAYAGGGYLMRVEPSSIKPWSTQGGLEYLGPPFDLSVAMRPVAAVDIQHREEGNWSMNLSPRLGIQFEQPNGSGRSLQLLAEFFKGKSPNGQFYQRNVEYVGAGVHLRF